MDKISDKTTVVELAAMGILSTRTANCVRFYAQYHDDKLKKMVTATTVGELRKMTDAEFLRIANFGRVSLAEIRRVLGRGPHPLYRVNRSSRGMRKRLERCLTTLNEIADIEHSHRARRLAREALAWCESYS